MRPLVAKKLIAVLEENDFVLSRQKGSHLIYKNKPIHIGTFLAIVKQSKLPKEKFM